MRIIIQKQGSILNLDEDEVRLRLDEKRLSLSDMAYCGGAKEWWMPLREVLEFLAAGRGEKIKIPSHWQRESPRQTVCSQPSPVKETPPPEYASFGQRLAAYVLDAIILVIVGFIIDYFWRLSAIRDGVTSQLALQVNTFFFNCAITWVYFTAMESSALQATVGKLALGIKVTDMNGHRVSFAKATGRWFGKWVSSLILTIGWWMAAFTEKRQALHDIMAGSLVMRR